VYPFNRNNRGLATIESTIESSNGAVYTSNRLQIRQKPSLYPKAKNYHY
jgi:hypothetical protein